jgi:hypothetical protein
MMHRVVANTPDGMICDHIYHDTLDNQEKELRNVTHSQSQMNTKIRSDNRLGIRGISVRTNRKSYVVQLNFHGKNVFKKEFKTIDEAIQARTDAEKKYHGAFVKQTKENSNENKA